ncbi:hypothetical protein HYALB_00004171 [Hymenoscyphus albidus]|uniref:Uncharacterized protein n=1 Tax=Hymenoscyphus albidus TaxID=595503 RepID=A0A9N9M027_9HELO|nr:hypothetical protein HYALB_00004171 [Hymenoscyphus albidus]
MQMQAVLGVLKEQGALVGVLFSNAGRSQYVGESSVVGGTIFQGPESRVEFELGWSASITLTHSLQFRISKSRRPWMFYYQSLQIADLEMASKSVSIPTATGANLPATSQATSNPKPCCVCKEEKASRDECMLFSNAKDPQKDCASTIDKYKSCMAGFGFNLP